MTGLTHIYTGDGKGKTTAALGLALRFVGNGGRAVVVQFLKGCGSAELKSLEALGIPVFRNSRDFGFWENMSARDKDACRQENDNNLRLGANSGAGLLVLDEVIAAYCLGALDKKALLELLHNKSRSMELVLTGRNAPPELMAYADYISEIKCVAHPYERGVQARRGIEL